jgi:hypothetical protein
MKSDKMDMQNFVDIIGEASLRQRKKYHLTPKKVKDKLSSVDSNLPVVIDHNGFGPKSIDSYRGYYSDLAIDSSKELCTVEKFLTLLDNIVGKTITGYKGGEFDMCDDTPLWSATFGSCGRIIYDMTITTKEVILKTKEDDI